MMDVWSAKRDDLLNRAVKHPALKPVAESWQTRIDRGLTLRQQIIEQSAESEALIAQIEGQREVVVADHQAALADDALETMQAMSDELGSMNERMTEIVTQANLTATRAELAQE